MSDFIEVFSEDFMQRALIAALLTGLAAPAIGTYLVQRRMALMGDGIGHIAVTGVAVGLLTGASPTWTAVLVTVLATMVMEVIRERGRTNGDVALALMFYGGLAGGVTLTGLGDKNTAVLQQYLFGSLTTISQTDVYTTLGLTVVVLALCLGLAPQFFAITQDQEFARVAGVRVRVYNLLIGALAAVSVTVAMRTVGLLLVSALLVVPVAAAQQFTRSFRSTIAFSIAVGTVASVGGLVLATYASFEGIKVSPGPTIVLLALACYALAWPIGVWGRHRARLREPFPEGVTVPERCDEEHPHVHGPGCGHLAVPHEDHVDYVHDGHRHAVHEGHYDEH